MPFFFLKALRENFPGLNVLDFSFQVFNSLTE